jgi:hypothetical protein
LLSENVVKMRIVLIGWLAWVVPMLAAQQPIGRTSATEVQVSGAVNISHGETLLGNGSEIKAGEQAVKIALERGGSLRLCSTSSVHLSKDRSVADPESSALMMALDRGAIEVNYTVGKYSDVLLTPDLRILISGPGQADLRIRVNTRGDTCVDNHGAEAPYVTVSSQLEGGAYRVMPDQRVNFENGSLREVVDHEPEPCGCPTVPVISVASAGSTGSTAAAPGRPVGGPSSTSADTAFPIAESEGLASPPTSRTPVVSPGETHAQVTVPLTYNGEASPPVAASSAPAGATPTPGSAPMAAAPAERSSPASADVTQATPPSQPEVAPTPAQPPASPPRGPPADGGGLMHRIGHFFSRIFGS